MADCDKRPRLSLDQPATYQIRVQGKLGHDWSVWFEGMVVAVEGNATTLTGRVADQAGLYGILVKIRDLGLPLISLTWIDPQQTRPDECNRTLP